MKTSEENESEKELEFKITINGEDSKNQKCYIIEGIRIYFPYEAYGPQIEYMTKVIKTLNNGCNSNICALESPTGTGKTLCLLCSVLGWMEHNNHSVKNIYYCTRTVSQINNALKELKRTCYQINNSFLASRKFTCLEMDDKTKSKNDSATLAEICNNAIKSKKDVQCMYYREKYCSLYSSYNGLTDMEDLLKEGEENCFCPYFYNIRKTKEYSNLTFMSYHYILNPFIRSKLNIIKPNAIVILDEAHNICNILENLFSRKLNEKYINNLGPSLQIYLDNLDDDKKNEFDTINDELNKVKKFINKVQKTKDFMKEKQNKIIDNDEEKEPIIYLCSYEEFTDLFFDNFSSIFFSWIIDGINNLICKINEHNRTMDTDTKEDKKIEHLTKAKNTIRKMFSFLHLLENIDPNDIPSFRFILSLDNKKGISFHIYCVDASLGMKNFMKIMPYSVILTSGTLSISLLENLLQIKFCETLNNSHVINNDQFLMNIIVGDRSKTYRFNFNNRKNEEQIITLGNKIKNLSKTVKKGGILVFFQSYEYLEKCFNYWSKAKIISKLEQIKFVIFDIKSQKEDIENKIKKAKEEKNMLLFTVYRGKNSEGINFKDDEARMVICVGIPYPNISDLKVRLKWNFLEEKYLTDKSGYSSREWYREEAFNAVNQALGRLIRDKDDYGIMICFGTEFREKSLFSKWIEPNIESIRMKEDNAEYYKGVQDYLIKMRKYDKVQDIINIDESLYEKCDHEESEENDDDNLEEKVEVYYEGDSSYKRDFIEEEIDEK